MKIYEKWREFKTNPEDINFKRVKILKQVSFPHCGNDVVECECEIDNSSSDNVFIKIERSSRAAFEIEAKNLKILQTNNYYSKIPKIIEEGNVNGNKYLVLTKILGERLSDIFLKTKDKIKIEYLVKYGQELAKIHNIEANLFPKARQRSINDYPNVLKYKEFDSAISPYINYLINNKPDINFDTFIHGDFHYGNILWKNKEIVGVLDWEYGGRGFKEQDIAWACILRLTQKFMDDLDDIINFLDGYKQLGTYEEKKLKWCLINGYCHFYLIHNKNKEYQEKLLKLLLQINKYFIND